MAPETKEQEPVAENRESAFKAVISRLFSNKFIQQLFFYTLCAAVATVFDWGSFWVFAEVLLIHHILSAILSYTIGGLVNYTMNKWITFQDKTKKVGAQMVIYGVIMAISYGLTALSMFLFVDILHLKNLLARILTTCIIFTYNFLMHRSFTFNESFRKRIGFE